jgi:hypothetical protein
LLRQLWSPAVGSAILGVALVAAGCDSDSGSRKSAEDASLAIALEDLANATTVMDDVWTSIENHPSVASLKVVGVPMVTVGAAGVETQGRTFVMDPTAFPQLIYVADDTRPGAPADGTRFVLYDPDADGRSLKQPFVESGYVDIIDQGSSEISVTMVHRESGPFSYSGSGVFESPDPTEIATAVRAFPGTREISYAGSIAGPSQTVTFDYRDAVIWYGGVRVANDRRTLLVETAGGDFVYRGDVKGNYLDSDQYVTLQVTLASGTDMVVTRAGARYPHMGSITGDVPISIGHCEVPGRENEHERCYLYFHPFFGNRRVESPIIDEFVSYTDRYASWGPGAERSPTTWGPGPIFALEAMSAPLLFALAQ